MQRKKGLDCPADRTKSAQTHLGKLFLFGITDGISFLIRLANTGLTAGKVKKQYYVYYLFIINARNYKYPYKHHAIEKLEYT